MAAKKSTATKAPGKRAKKRVSTMRQSDRDDAGALARAYRAGDVDGDFLAGALEVLAEDGTFAKWSRAVNMMLGDYTARSSYQHMRKTGVSQLEAVEQLMERHGVSERTIKEWIYRKPKPAT